MFTYLVEDVVLASERLPWAVREGELPGLSRRKQNTVTDRVYIVAKKQGVCWGRELGRERVREKQSLP